MEQKKMSKAYAVDFDGTLCENRWPEIGEPNQELIGYLVGRRQQGAASEGSRVVSGTWFEI